MSVAAIIDQAVHAPAGTGARRNAWLVAAGMPLAVGLCVATVQPAVNWHLALQALSGAVLVLALGVSSYTDTLWRKIPNWATYSAILWALALNSIASVTLDTQYLSRLQPFVGPIGIGSSLFGAAACFTAMFFIFRLAGSGAGDVKMATALGALLGTEYGLTAIVWCHLTAGMVMLAWLIWQVGPLAIVTHSVRYIGAILFPTRIAAPGYGAKKLLCQPVPLAPFFAAGTIITFIQGPIL